MVVIVSCASIDLVSVLTVTGNSSLCLVFIMTVMIAICAGVNNRYTIVSVLV